MTHLDEGRIQAFLDDELPGRERAAAAAHLVACPACRTIHEELSQARSVFSTAIPVLDVAWPPSGAATPPARRSRTLRPSLVQAAVLVLLMAAVASAAVKGSPVRQWLVGEPEAAAPEPAPVTTPAHRSDAGSSAVTVAGTVRDQADRPLAFAQVGVVGDTISGWTDEAGRFRLEGGQHERWRLRATHPGYRAEELAVELPAAGALDVDLRLEALPGPTPDPLSLFEPFRVTYTLPELLNADAIRTAIDRAYPAGLVEAGIGGEAVLWLWLDEVGRVARSVIATSSGQAELDSVALRVSRDMRFRPARSDGRTIRVIVQIPVVFAAGVPDAGPGPEAAHP